MEMIIPERVTTALYDKNSTEGQVGSIEFFPTLIPDKLEEIASILKQILGTLKKNL